jgi:hypothetical protein
VTLADRRDLLAVVLDALVPPGDGFPGAGAVALEHVLARASGSAALDALLSSGLEAIEAGPALATLGADEREQILRGIEQSRAEFFQALVRLTYEGYYAHPTVVARLGLDPRPPHPGGHRVESVEAPDLARVTARGRLYRPA